jgi:molecular chaperone GrpE
MSENEMSENEISEVMTENPELDKLEQKIEELSDKLLRSMAECENIRRRYEKQLEEMSDYSITNFAKDLIPVIDNLERAITFGSTSLSDDVKNVLNGVMMTYNELTKVFEKYGIVLVSPKEGDKFDYNSHFAISQIDHETYEKDTIVGLMQVGYKIKERLLRPAAVSVAKPKE